jgi:hypothetical protein
MGELKPEGSGRENQSVTSRIRDNFIWSKTGLGVLVFLSIISWIILFKINPYNIITWVALFTTGSFVLRPFGIHTKVTKIIPVEGLFAFLAFNGSLIFKTFDIVTYLLMIGIRLVFYAIVWYDDTQYVYVQEEEEKEI